MKFICHIIWKVLASTALTVLLAVIICLLSAWGSIIVVKNQAFYSAMDQVVLMPWLLDEGLEHLGATGWVFALITLMALFALNTAVCTIDKVYGIIKSGRPFQTLFPHIVHVGFLVAMLGHLMGSVFGFRSYGNILYEGEVTPVPNTTMSIRLDGFSADVNRHGDLSTLKSSVTLFNKDEVIETSDVTINGPLIHKGVAFYHTNQGRVPRGLILEIGEDIGGEIEGDVGGKIVGEMIEAPFGGEFRTSDGRGYLLGNLYPDFALDEDGRPYSLSNEYRNPHQEIIVEHGETASEDGRAAFEHGGAAFLDLSTLGSRVELKGRTILFRDLSVKPYVVFTINKDPGIWLIIVGSAILVLGMALLLLFRGERAELVRRPLGGSQSP